MRSLRSTRHSSANLQILTLGRAGTVHRGSDCRTPVSAFSRCHCRSCSARIASLRRRFWSAIRGRTIMLSHATTAIARMMVFIASANARLRGGPSQSSFEALSLSIGIAIGASDDLTS